MPHLPIPHRRVPNREETVTVDGHEVELYSYAEEYYYQWSLIRGLLGFDKTYKRRHLRAEAPEYYHSRVAPDVSYEEQKAQLLSRVKQAKKKQKELAQEVN